MNYTKDECKRILSKLGFKLGISPTLISTRLMSKDDKNDMMEGSLPIESLECHIIAFKASGMPDYANGNTKPLVIEKSPYRGVFRRLNEETEWFVYNKPFCSAKQLGISPVDLTQ
jgi:hypothetical protein